jgi:hypothetical protein
MTLSKVEFKSGIIKDDTPLASEGGWIDCDKVRFKQGKPQTIGGWEVASVEQFTGIARGAHAWTDLRGDKQIAFGTAANLYAYTGGEIVDITPNFSSGVLTNPFATVNGSPTVTVTLEEHGLVAGMSITFSNADAVGGLTLSGAYPVVSVVTRDTFTITASGNASSTATGGGGVDYVVAFPAGLVDGAGGRGYGTGSYGVGEYGLPNQTDFLPAVWSFANLGEILIANRRGSPLYIWQPQAEYGDIILTGDFATDTNWAKGTGWAIGSGVATKTAGTLSNLSQNVQGVAQGGYVYKITFTVTRSGGTLKLRANAGSTPAIIDMGAASTAINKSGTYTRNFVMPADMVDIVFEGDSSFAGTIDNVSLVLESRAIMVAEAPRRIDSIFVAPEGVVVAVGTYEVDGDYNPNAVRNSDIGNVRSWVPDTDSLASEIILRGGGGRLVRGLATRQQNLIWGDDGLFRLQWQGEVGAAFTSDLLGTGCGLIGLNAAAEHNGIAFWLSNNGNFYIFQGAIPQVIDCRVRRDVFDNISPSQEEKIYCGINAENSEAWWFYPDSRDGNECSRYMGYNWIEQHSIVGTFARSSWIRPGIYGYPVAFGTDGYIYFHELGMTANGGALESYLQTSAFDIEDGNNLFIVKAIIPDFDDQSGSVDFTLKTRAFPNATDYDGVTQTAASSTQILRMRRLGRQATLRLEASAAPSFWRLGALRLDVQKIGAER